LIQKAPNASKMIFNFDDDEKKMIIVYSMGWFKLLDFILIIDGEMKCLKPKETHHMNVASLYEYNTTIKDNSYKIIYVRALEHPSALNCKPINNTIDIWKNGVKLDINSYTFEVCDVGEANSIFKRCFKQ